LLLVGFTGLIGYGWFFHDLRDCGCFGSIAMTPGVSTAKNFVLLALCGIVSLAPNPTETQSVAFKPRSRARTLGRAALALAFGLATSAYSYAHLESRAAAGVQTGPFAQFVFEADGSVWDLGQGEYLVALLSATCEHCIAAVESLNALMQHPDVPPIVALCEGQPDSLQQFRDLTSPEFPIHPVGIRVFYELIGTAPPRFTYIRDGKPIAFWDEHIPAPAEIAQARSSPAA
jgi:hypothetical protein